MTEIQAGIEAARDQKAVRQELLDQINAAERWARSTLAYAWIRESDPPSRSEFDRARRLTAAIKAVLDEPA